MIRWREVRRVDDDRPIHAVADVMQRRCGAAVIHEDAGVLGFELVVDQFTGHDRAHLIVPSHATGVEVERVANRHDTPLHICLTVFDMQ